MAVTVPIGGCCCGGGETCPACDSCPALVASDYCVCLTQIVYTEGIGAPCPAFTVAIDPPLCIVGVCVDSLTIIRFLNPDERIIDLGGGRTLTIAAEEFEVTLKCSDIVGEKYALTFLLAFTLSDCGVVELGLVDIASTVDCDQDSMLGTYEPDFILLPSGDHVIPTVTFTKGGSCP